MFFEQILRAVRTAFNPVRTGDERLTNGYPFQNGYPLVYVFAWEVTFMCNFYLYYCYTRVSISVWNPRNTNIKFIYLLWNSNTMMKLPALISFLSALFGCWQNPDRTGRDWIGLDWTDKTWIGSARTYKTWIGLNSIKETHIYSLKVGIFQIPIPWYLWIKMTKTDQGNDLVVALFLLFPSPFCSYAFKLP